MTDELRRRAREAAEQYAAEARERGREVPPEVVEEVAESEYRRMVYRAENQTPSPTTTSSEVPSVSGDMQPVSGLYARVLGTTKRGLSRRMAAWLARPEEERAALLARDAYACQSCQDAGVVWMRTDDERFERARVAGMNRSIGRIVRIDDPTQVHVWCADCPPLLQRHRQLRGSITSDDAIEARFDRFDAYRPDLRAMRAQAERWAARVERRPFLLMVGTAGAGKSHLAKAIALTMAESGYSVQFATARQLLDTIKSTFDRDDRTQPTTGEAMREIAASGVLVIDDLGAEYASRWGASTLEGILFERYEQRALTVITANKDLAGLARHQDDPHLRLVDRLNDIRRTVYVETDAPSWRVGGGRPKAAAR